MLNSDSQILQRIRDWLQQQQPVFLFTVIRTWGSSPRPAGSLLAISRQGEFIGSVSGGCVDDDLLRRVTQDEFKDCPSHFIYYGETADSQHLFKLPCGGSLQLLVESQLDLSEIKSLLVTLQQRNTVCRRLSLQTFASSLHLHAQANTLVQNTFYISRQFGPNWRLLLIGAGELSQQLCQIAGLFDYHVVVCDPREEYRNSWPLTAIPLTAVMPDDWLQQHPSDNHSIVLALSHDPKLDDMALMTALQQPAFYVGALGSTANNQQRRKRLQQLGLSESQTAQLHGPVGLDLGSHTPAEIALSIMADITARRHGKILRCMT